MFEKYVLRFDRIRTTTAEALVAKFKYSPELGDTTATLDKHIEKCVYNPDLLILPYLDGKIDKQDKIALRKVIEFTRFKYFTSFDVDYGSTPFPVVTDHCALPIFSEAEEEIVLKYITKNNGFKNIKKEAFVESDWQRKEIKYLPAVETMFSYFMSK